MKSEKNINVDFQYFSGGHNNVCWQGLVSDGLIALHENRIKLTANKAESIESNFTKKFT